ncbi:uncharacterized protein [Macrobrachium rosenbergii]|uniref:uncharacterized protein n=1 Tax=Macrobrachium rosenbergii TaxID=79674 RepID=UPI0034D40108
MSERYIWWGIKADIKKWARECLLYQTSKITRHTETRIGEFQTTQRRLARIDLNTRWPEAMPVGQQVAENCVSTWLGQWTWSTTIHNEQQRSQLHLCLIELLSTSPGQNSFTQQHTTQKNSMVERLHCSLKSALTVRCQGELRNELPWILPGLRSIASRSISQLLALGLHFSHGQALVVLEEISKTRQSPRLFQKSVEHWKTSCQQGQYTT